MQLEEKLTLIRRSYVSDVSLVSAFVRSTDESLLRKEREKPPVPKNLTQSDRKQLARFSNYLDQVINGQAVRASFTWKSTTAIQVVTSVFEKLFSPQYRMFLAEMALAYLVALQEAFVKDYLQELFASRSRLLKSGKQVTFEEVCSHRSMRTLLQYLAEKEVETVSYKNIDKLAKYVETRFNLSLACSFPSWEELREASYRRNVIVHNHGKVSQIYVNKVGRGKVGEKMHTDAEYVVKTASFIRNFIEFFDESLARKFT